MGKPHTHAEQDICSQSFEATEPGWQEREIEGEGEVPYAMVAGPESGTSQPMRTCRRRDALRARIKTRHMAIGSSLGLVGPKPQERCLGQDQS